MKLYAVLEISESFIDGSSMILLGVYSSRDKAYNKVSKCHDWDEYKPIGNEDNCWINVFDGELSIYRQIDEIELDEDIW